MIVLDTDVISNLTRPRPSPALIARLAAVPMEEQYTTAITIGELAYGAERAGRPDLYERSMQLMSSARILPLDQAAAEQYGRIRADLERQGRRLADPDLRIAAIVLAHRGILISGNLRHFSRVPGLSVEDWLNA